MKDLAPEARDVLALELSRRGISSGAVKNFSEESKQISNQETEQKVNSLFPSLRGIRARISDWRFFRKQTGHWPRLSIVFYFAHGVLAWTVMLLAVWYGIVHIGSKLLSLMLFTPIILIDAFLSEWAERKIRLRELSQYRAPRQS
jgi:hypothetical protein